MLQKKFQVASRPAELALLHYGDEVWTYGRFQQAVESASERLAEAEIGQGSVVAIDGPYTPEAIVQLFALADRGAVSVPLVGLSNAAREERLRVAGAQWVLEKQEGNGFQLSVAVDCRSGETAGGNQHPLIAKLARAGHPGLILFSSGTTGTPKAMLHDLVKLTEGYTVKMAGGGPVTLAFLNYDHIGGLDILFRALASGASLVIPERRDPECVARTIERHQVEVLPASPTFLNLFLLSGVTEKHDLSALRIIGYGSEPMPESLLRRLASAVPWVRLQQKFGTSETNAVRVVSRSPDSLEMRVEDSRVQWKVVDGELWLKSPSRILGYLNADNSILPDDGWYRTGDLVEETGDGFFRIVGRRSDQINVGGEKVFPSEVEAVLLEIPELRECRVFGESHPLTGQVVAVEAVATEDLSLTELKKRIRAFCRDRLEPHKIPVKVYRVEVIETGENFKKRRGGD